MGGAQLEGKFLASRLCSGASSLKPSQIPFLLLGPRGALGEPGFIQPPVRRGQGPGRLGGSWELSGQVF